MCNVQIYKKKPFVSGSLKSNPFKLQKFNEKRSSYCSNITIFTCAARKTQLLKKLTARGRQARNANRKNGLVCYPTLWEPKKAPDQSNWPHYDQALYKKKIRTLNVFGKFVLIVYIILLFGIHFSTLIVTQANVGC